MIRAILAVIAGVVSAIVVILIAEAIGALAAPSPAPPPNLTNAAAMREFLATLPWQSYAFILGAYVLGAAAGAIVAVRVSVNPDARTPWVVGGIMLAITIANLVALPHPAWFWVAAVLAISAGTILGRQLGPVGRPRAA